MGRIPPLKLYWTRHAVARLAQRFGLDHGRKTPGWLICQLGRGCEIGQAFEIAYQGTRYVARRVQDGVLIITVIVHHTSRSKRFHRPKRQRRN